MNKLSSMLGKAVFWLAWPGLWLILRWSHRTRLLLICGNEFLVLKGRLSMGKWGLPGGGLHRDETAVNGLIREVREETGIKVSASQILHAFDGVSNEHGLRFYYHAFVMQLAVKPVVKLQVLEITAAAWQPLKNPALPLSEDAETVRQWWLNQV